jgi:mannose-1-phosphate guanylyltransferase
LMALRGEGTEPIAEMVTKAAVLCGGEGTRLRPLTNYFQKTMIPVGSKKRPLLEYIVRLIAYNGIKDIILLTGYRSEDIEGYFEDGSKFGVRITYSRDEENGGGSGRSLQNAIASGAVGQFDDLLVYYGDVLSTLRVKDLIADHDASRSAMSLVLSKDYRLPVGVAQVERDRVISFTEKPTMPLNVTVGGLVISNGCIPVLATSATRPGNFDIMTHFVPAAIAEGLKVSPFYIEGFWYDVGTTEAYEKLDTELVDSNLSFLD